MVNRRSRQHRPNSDEWCNPYRRRNSVGYRILFNRENRRDWKYRRNWKYRRDCQNRRNCQNRRDWQNWRR
jgi:hypothetical protein